MIYCTLNLREISQDNTLKLRCAGSGVYDVFSGLGHLKNNPDAYMEKMAQYLLESIGSLIVPLGGLVRY